MADREYLIGPDTNVRQVVSSSAGGSSDPTSSHLAFDGPGPSTSNGEASADVFPIIHSQVEPVPRSGEQLAAASDLSRQLTIAHVRGAQPIRRIDSVYESFEVRDTVSKELLYRIQRWVDTSMGLGKSRLVMELTDDSTDGVLSRWVTPVGVTACVCCCNKCLSKLGDTGDFAPNFSLQVRSPSGSIEGSLKLMDQSIHVLSSNKVPLYQINCVPVLINMSAMKHQISWKGQPSSTSEESYSIHDSEGSSARIVLQPTGSDAHDMLLLAGLFTLHFAVFQRPGHSEDISQGDCCDCQTECGRPSGQCADAGCLDWLF